LVQKQEKKADINAHIKNAIAISYGYAIAQVKIVILKQFPRENIDINLRAKEDALAIRQRTLMNSWHCFSWSFFD
jgi:hypothetical protein